MAETEIPVEKDPKLPRETNERALPPGTGRGTAETVENVRPSRVPPPGPRAQRPRPKTAVRTPPPDRIRSDYQVVEVETPDEMRIEIEATRARISETLDELEGRLVHEKQQLVRKKDELVDKATLKGFRQKMAEEPFRHMAIAFVAGYVIAAIRD